MASPVTNEDMKNLLAETVIAVQGIKATELCAREEIVRATGDFDVPSLLDELVKEGRLVEVEYVLPQMEWRAKSFYLPAGSTGRILSKAIYSAW